MMKLTILLMLTMLSLAVNDSEFTSNTKDDNVTLLNLSNLGIASLQNYHFSKYPALETLDLSNNNIKYIPAEMLLKNPKLKVLNLSGNRQLVLPEFVLLIANIEELNLSNCNIEKLPLHVGGLIFLQTVDLSKNPLQKQAIKLSMLMNLMRLQKVILPYEDKQMIEEICTALEITFEINDGKNSSEIQCSDVRKAKSESNHGEAPTKNKPETENAEDLHHKAAGYKFQGENRIEQINKDKNLEEDKDAHYLVISQDKETKTNLNIDNVEYDYNSDEYDYYIEFQTEDKEVPQHTFNIKCDLEIKDKEELEDIEDFNLEDQKYKQDPELQKMVIANKEWISLKNEYDDYDDIDNDYYDSDY